MSNDEPVKMVFERYVPEDHVHVSFQVTGGRGASTFGAILQAHVEEAISEYRALYPDGLEEFDDASL